MPIPNSQRREYLRDYFRAYNAKRREYLNVKQREYRANPMPKGLRRAVRLANWRGMVETLCR